MAMGLVLKSADTATRISRTCNIILFMLYFDFYAVVAPCTYPIFQGY